MTHRELLRTVMGSAAAVLLLVCHSWAAAPPPLRDQVLLSGTWDNHQTVPQYAGISNFDKGDFSRGVVVPASWVGKIVKVEFGAVNFVADVFVDNRLVAHHVGGWMPFAVDITPFVKPGAAFTLHVAVAGPKHPPITNENGGVQWPVGAWSSKGGIADDVFLRAYGTVHIEDTFVRTSFRDKMLLADYTIVNADTKPRTVVLRGDATPANGGKGTAAKGVSFTSVPLTLRPGERKLVTRRTVWKNPTLWWPDAPVLYHLRSRLMENNRTVDEETRRFGFREIWIANNQFMMNGVRVNLFGDYQSIDPGYYSSSSDLTPNGWPATVDKIKAMNIRVLRFHHCPAPAYLLDVCDEKGLLVCSEAANYARPYHLKTDKTDYIHNAVASVAPWIISQRNHPSIYLWNATNEMTYPQLGGFTPEQCAAVGNAIAALDPSRPVGYDGDTENGAKAYGRVQGVLVNHHYPEGYNKEPKGSIYGWAKRVHPTKPTGSGELLHTRDSSHPELQGTVERNQWWLGIWLRGLRWANWTDVRPAVFWFAAKDLQNPNPLGRVRGENVRNALAPIALFDKAYDDLGIAPFVTGTTPGGTLPALTGGATETRTLVLYNDDFRDPRVTITVVFRVNNKEQLRGTKTFSVPLGRHVEIPITFTVPGAKNDAMVEMVLRTEKSNQTRFEEIRRFRVAGSETLSTGGSPLQIGSATLVP